MLAGGGSGSDRTGNMQAGGGVAVTGTPRSPGGAASETTRLPTHGASGGSGLQKAGVRWLARVLALALVFMLGLVGGTLMLSRTSIGAVERTFPAMRSGRQYTASAAAAAAAPVPVAGSAAAGKEQNAATVGGGGGSGRCPPAGTAAAGVVDRSVGRAVRVAMGQDGRLPSPIWMEGVLNNLWRGTGKAFQFNRIYADDDNKLLYCSIEKTACTAWRRVMYRMQHPHDATYMSDVSEFRIHNWFLNATKAPSADVARDVAWEKLGKLADEAYTAFVIARDPVDRFVSAYLNKCVQEPEKCAVNVSATPPGVELIDYLLDELLDTPIDVMNVHFRPLYSFCGLRLLSRSYRVIRFNHMVADAYAVAAAAHLPPARHALLMGALKDNIDTDEKANPTTELKDLTAALLNRRRMVKFMLMYADDYEIFGFPLPPIYLEGGGGIAATAAFLTQ